MTTINTGSTKKNKQKTYTNYKKAKWDEFKDYVENKVEEMQETEDPHEMNKKLTTSVNS